jgi:type I restriction enzyme S subunit
MKSYPKYKSSSVEALGEIPAHWDVRKITHSFDQIGSGTTPESGNPEYYQNGNINWLLTGDLNDGEIYSTSKQITEKAKKKFPTLRLYPINSLVIAMYGATIGKLGLLKIEATTNQACCVLSGSEEYDMKYAYYWFLAYKTHIINLSYGGGQPNISQDLIRSQKLQHPPLAEQNIIVSFLDEKTKQIDTLIEKKERMIELLKEERQAVINEAVTKGIDPKAKMKDSGIEGLGEIPEHWEHKKLKFILNSDGLVRGPFGSALKVEYFKKTGYKVYEQKNAIRKDLSLGESHISQEKYEELVRFTVKENDFLMSCSGTIGKIVRVTGDYKKGIINQAMLIIRLKEIAFDYDYFENLFESRYFQMQILDNSMGSAIKNLVSTFQFQNITIPLPPYKEQKQVSLFIKVKEKQFDLLIEKAEKAIELLQEYRTALITEVVTGKVCVI